MKKTYSEKTIKHSKTRDEPNKHAGKKSSAEDGKKKTPDGQESGTHIRCFNCGTSGHHARNCDKKALRKKCFNCNKFGHEAKNCEEKKKNSSTSNSEQAVNLVDVSLSKVFKNIVINNMNLQTLMDTGSPAGLVREAFKTGGRI